MRAFQCSIRIAATPETVWALITDGPGYPKWNSTVEKVEGSIAAGSRIAVHAKIAPGRAFPVTVVEFEPGRRMVWAGGMPFGLFTGRRTFTLTKSGERAVDFGMREEFSGLMAPLISRSIPDLQPAFDAFAADLKLAAERTA